MKSLHLALNFLHDINFNLMNGLLHCDRVNTLIKNKSLLVYLDKEIKIQNNYLNKFDKHYTSITSMIINI